MQELTPEGLRIVDDLARRHAVSRDAVETLLQALIVGHGTQAQFTHPDLGGMGQWSQGGMIMVGDMFNQDLKYRVDTFAANLPACCAVSLCSALPRQARHNRKARAVVMPASACSSRELRRPPAPGGPRSSALRVRPARKTPCTMLVFLRRAASLFEMAAR